LNLNRLVQRIASLRSQHVAVSSKPV